MGKLRDFFVEEISDDTGEIDTRHTEEADKQLADEIRRNISRAKRNRLPSSGSNEGRIAYRKPDEQQINEILSSEHSDYIKSYLTLYMAIVANRQWPTANDALVFALHGSELTYVQPDEKNSGLGSIIVRDPSFAKWVIDNYSNELMILAAGNRN